MEQLKSSLRDGQVLHLQEELLDTECCQGNPGEPWSLPPAKTMEVWISTDDQLNVLRQEIAYMDMSGTVLQRSSVADGRQVTRDLTTGDEYVNDFSTDTPLELPWLAPSGLLVDLDEDWQPEGTTTLRGQPASVYELVSPTDGDGLAESYVEVKQHLELPHANPHLGRFEVLGIESSGSSNILSSVEVLAFETLPAGSVPEPLQPSS